MAQEKDRQALSNDLNLHIYFHQVDPGFSAKLDQILAAVTNVQQQENTVMVDLSALQDEVSKNTDVVGSAKTLIQSLVDQISQIGATADAATQAKINDLVASLQANDANLAQAVADNTPAQNPPPPVP